ncbi:molybdate-anion transporter [Tanacetum coccineum]
MTSCRVHPAKKELLKVNDLQTQPPLPVQTRQCFKKFSNKQYELDQNAKMERIDREVNSRVALYDSQNVAEDLKVLQMSTDGMDPVEATINAQKARIRALYAPQNYRDANPNIITLMEGVQSVFGEYEMAYFGLSKEQMVTNLIIGCASTILVGTCLGMLSVSMLWWSCFTVVVVVVDRGISCGGQSVFMYVVVVVALDCGGRSRSGCEVMEGQVVLVVASSSGACDEEWWSCFGDFLFIVLTARVMKVELEMVLQIEVVSLSTISTFRCHHSRAKESLLDVLRPALFFEHEKLGHRLDSLNEMFWLMSFLESASLIGSQVLANWLVSSNDVHKNMVSPSTATAILALLCIIFIAREWRESPPVTFKEYRMSLKTHIFSDKRILLLGWAQSCVQFAVAAFWILWAPTIVADGREVHLGMIYPCLLGARMLGSAMFPWFINGPLPLRTEDCLVYAFAIAGIVLSIVAYDYQEIGILIGLFCLFHACIGLVLPSLARLRTLYVPNELRAGMISLSLAPSNAAILLCLIQRGYNSSIENSTILAFAAIAMFSAAGCMHLLKQSGKHSPHQNFHKQ